MNVHFGLSSHVKHKQTNNAKPEEQQQTQTSVFFVSTTTWVILFVRDCSFLLCLRLLVAFLPVYNHKQAVFICANIKVNSTHQPVTDRGNVSTCCPVNVHFCLVYAYLRRPCI